MTLNDAVMKKLELLKAFAERIANEGFWDHLAKTEEKSDLLDEHKKDADKVLAEVAEATEEVAMISEIYNQVTKVDNPFNEKLFMSSLQSVLSDKVFSTLIDPRHRARGDYLQITVKMEVKELEE